MDPIPATRATLLLRIRDPGNTEAWRQFVQLYAPLVYAYARRRQLQEADAADLTQEVLQSLMKAVGRLDYDPDRGSFRGWLFRVTRNKLLDFQRRRSFGATGGSTAQDLLDQQPAREEEDVWTDEFRRRVFAVAAEEVRQEFAEGTWQAFWQTAVEGKKPREVAESLGISVGAVYIAKSRVQARLKERVRQIADAE